jgi:branched-chain amino acid transport system substrate-binding protein
LRKLLLCLICAALFLLAACGQTAARMTEEVGGWFHAGKAAPQQSAFTKASADGSAPVSTPANNQVMAMAEPPAVEPVPAPAPASPVMNQPAPSKSPVTNGRALKAAILLPLSGEQEDLGKSLLHGAELAVMELGNENFELMPRDSGSSPAEAVNAAREALASGARLIIGPLFSSSVEAVKPVAAQAGVPILALSNDWKVAGQGAYLIGFSPIEQVQKIAQFAASQNLNDIAVLAPSSTYGQLALSALSMPGSPLHVKAVVRYQNNAASIAAAVQEIAMKRGEFQAIFLPEGGDTLRRIAAQLAARNITARDVPFLGTGLWDDENLGDTSALVGGWYAAPDSSALASFMARYQKNFGAKPARLASLAYDATALAVALATRGGPDPFAESELTNPNGFAGLDGIFRLNASGLAEHGLAVKEVTPAGPRILEAAPGRF